MLHPTRHPPRLSRPYFVPTLRPPETGAALSFLASELEAVVVEALQDDAVQQELKNTVVEVMEDPSVRTSLRPHLIEAAIWLGVAVTTGIVVGRAVTRRF